MLVELRYHVSRSQVWPRSRGVQPGDVHLHVLEPFESGRLRRAPGGALCGRRGWYERAPEHPSELEADARCSRCVAAADRHGVTWPA